MPSEQELRAHLRALAPFDVKLRPPELRPGLVPRPALLGAVDTSAPMIVLSAPAGYGKTTLLAQWALGDRGPVAWLTATPGDNDPVVLTAYLVRAIDTVEPLDRDVLASFAAPGQDGARHLLPLLGQVVSTRTSSLAVVIDDVHVLHDEGCVEILEVLAAHLPPGGRLALAGRDEVRVATARRRALGGLTELGLADLALSSEDGVAALQRAGLDLDVDVLRSIVERVEGWPVGVYLTALAARDLTDPGQALQLVRGDHPFVAGYLHDEMVAGLDDDVVDFLMRTSVLGYFDGPLCDEVLGRAGSAEVLAELAASNLFVVPLDTAAGQYRYHRLFAEALQSELLRRAPDAVAALHARASVAFEARGAVGLAVSHARAAGDHARAAALVWVHATPYLGSGRSATVERWLAAFDQSDFDAHPPLALAAAWCAVTAHEPRPVSPWIDIARRGDLSGLLPDGTPLGSAVVLLEAMAAERGLTAMVASADQAYLLDVEGSPFRPLARMLSGVGLGLLGERDVAEDRLEEAAAAGSQLPAVTTTSLSHLATLAVANGDWIEARRLVDRALALADHYLLGQQPAQSLLFAVAALVAAHRRDSIEARRLARHAARLAPSLGHWGAWLKVEVHLVLARVELELGDLAAARRLVGEARALLEGVPDPGLLAEDCAELSATVAARGVSSTTGANALTKAEMRVLCYLPTHLSFQAIADDLIVSRNTVRTQAAAVYRKLGVSSRHEAVVAGRALGLLDEVSG